MINTYAYTPQYISLTKLKFDIILMNETKVILIYLSNFYLPRELYSVIISRFRYFIVTTTIKKSIIITNEIVLEYDGSVCIELVNMLTTCTCNCAPTPFQILYPPLRYVTTMYNLHHRS